MVRLAGPEAVYARATLELQPEVVAMMADVTRANAQRYGAVAMLLEAKATLDGPQTITLHAPREPLDGLLVGAKQLLGDFEVKRQGTRVRLQLKERLLDTFSPSFSALLKTASIDDSGAIALTSRWSAGRKADVLKGVLGTTAVLDGNRAIFDNRGYSLLNLEDARAELGEAFTSGRLSIPTLLPIGVEIAGQRYDDPNITVRHQGTLARWGDAFSDLGYLHGARSDLAKVTPSSEDWILMR